MAWSLVAAGRFLSKSEDAAEATRKALDIYRSLRHPAGEAQTLIELAKGQLSLQDSLNALATAREALKVSRENGLWLQVGRSVEAIVEAQLQAGHPDAALEEAEEQLTSMGSNKGTSAMMSAVVVATAALRGADPALEKVKSFVRESWRVFESTDCCLVFGCDFGVPPESPFLDGAMANALPVLGVSRARGGATGPWRNSVARKVLAVTVAVWAAATSCTSFAGVTPLSEVLPRSRWSGKIVRHAYSNMKVKELKDLLSERGLKVSGLKAELIARLEEHDNGANNGADEVEEEEEKEAAEVAVAKTPSPAPKSAPKGPVEFKAGQLALALFHDDGRYYSVKVKKDNGDGSFDIMWLEDEAEDTAQLEDLKPQLKDFKKGDLVVAKCAEDGQRYTALVQENKGEGYVTVQYIEDETEEE
eukprot:symbB.v1.2.037366.t1/scaffold5498.1/size37837/1